MKKQNQQDPMLAGQYRPTGGATEDYGVKRIQVGQDPLRSRATGQKLLGAGSTPTRQRSGAKTAISRGRLDREVLIKLGRALKDCFDEVRQQEVPERFKILLQQY